MLQRRYKFNILNADLGLKDKTIEDLELRIYQLNSVNSKLEVDIEHGLNLERLKLDELRSKNTTIETLIQEKNDMLNLKIRNETVYNNLMPKVKQRMAKLAV
jgi:hypothetical protein